jgi:hypothetical protein
MARDMPRSGAGHVPAKNINDFSDDRVWGSQNDDVRRHAVTAGINAAQSGGTIEAP